MASSTASAIHSWGEGSEASGVRRCKERGLEAVRVSNAFGSLLAFRHGAHVVQYQPATGAPVLWLSEKSRFQEGSAIRGGVPICFPWFGPHADSSKPAHGFARTRAWAYAGSRMAGEGTKISFELAADDRTRALWPFEFRARLHATLGTVLTLELEVENTGPSELDYEEALHSYFAVEDVREIAVDGLSGAAFDDKVAGVSEVQTEARLVVRGEVDRVYVSEATCRVLDPKLGRELRIEKSGSRSTVVWNPWLDKAKRLSDFAHDEYLRMMCVESGNTHDQRVRLAPGATHTLRIVVSSRPLAAER